jgi:hypothetical protein
MRFLVTALVPVEIGNLAFKNPDFGRAVADLLADIRPVQAYFGVQAGRRCFYLLVDLQDSTQIARVAEPLWHALNAEVEFIPVMEAAELSQAAPAIRAAAAKY